MDVSITLEPVERQSFPVQYFLVKQHDTAVLQTHQIDVDNNKRIALG